MSTAPIIFPSLSRAPTMDSSLQVMDDTIRDQFETGYVATRPRFTRSRRTWNVNVRNMTAEDVRALDYFAEVTVQRGGLSFYYPNLLPNSSFENGPTASGEAFDDWYVTQTNAFSVEASTAAVDGKQSALIYSTPGAVIPIGGYRIGQITSGTAIPVTAGDTYLFSASISLVTFGTVPSGVVFGTGLNAVVTFADGTTQGFPIATSVISPVFAPFAGSFTIPALSASGSPPVSMLPSLYLDFTNNSSASITFAAAGSSFSLWSVMDAVGLALTASSQAYGRTAGSKPIPAPVRFAASKIPQFSDLGYGNGAKIYGSTFALEEV